MPKCAFCGKDSTGNIPCTICGKQACSEDSLFLYQYSLGDITLEETSICRDHWQEPTIAKIISEFRELKKELKKQGK
jgi:hypothetical protein